MERHFASILESWGLRVELGKHVFSQVGYLAGADEERLADMNEALRDEGVRAIFATRGACRLVGMHGAISDRITTLTTRGQATGRLVGGNLDTLSI